MSGTAVTFFFSKRSDILSKTKMKRKADILSHYIHRFVDFFFLKIIRIHNKHVWPDSSLYQIHD